MADQTQKTLPAVEKLIAEQTARFEAAVAEINKLQSKSVARSTSSWRARPACPEQIAFAEQLGGEWRKLVLSATRNAADLFAPRRRDRNRSGRPPGGRARHCSELIDPLRRERSTEVAMARLEGRTALVTGASRGLGRAIALKLAEDGPAWPQLPLRGRAAREVADLIHSLAALRSSSGRLSVKTRREA